ncbi:hypothetical protein [Acetobacter oryzifermentans]|uniref:DUF4376 domain-containing protein n=1 Tax=Acetobacter oryzifermentans TaxID=1633874 RepID=A0ABN4NLR4_9PROT|nr:hypothetical protein [Acetobacter oryzifermentans]ANA12886.1 hypothetical protein WG31_01680 [Acetobacter oryzifermentans]
MTDITNWPDPNSPGVPMFPERDGWHVMEGRVAGQTALTHWNGREWGGGEQVRALNTSPEWYRYVGPVLTPTQINEMLAAERERIKSMVARACEGNIITASQRDMLIAGIDSETAIRNLGAAS